MWTSTGSELGAGRGTLQSRTLTSCYLHGHLTACGSIGCLSAPLISSHIRLYEGAGNLVFGGVFSSSSTDTANPLYIRTCKPHTMHCLHSSAPVHPSQHLRPTDANTIGEWPQKKVVRSWRTGSRNAPGSILNTETVEDAVRNHRVRVSFCFHLAVDVMHASANGDASRGSFCVGSVIHLRWDRANRGGSGLRHSHSQPP